MAVGGSAGQGYTFMLGQDCFAYTAGHVLGSVGAAVVLTDREAFQATGRAVAIDKRLDLGLVQINDPGKRAQKLCSRGRSPTLIVADGLLARARTSGPNAWMDMVSTAAGGLDRFELDLRPDGIGDERLLLSPTAGTKARVDARMPQRGDSGASVWGSESDTERSRYDKEGNANIRQVGMLLGVHVGVHGGKSVVIRSDVLHEFIFQSIQPVRWDSVAIEPSTVKVSKFRRGVMPTETREHVMALSDQILDRVTWELDLGEDDMNVTGVTVHTKASGPGLTSYGRTPSVKVSTSQYRPGEQTRSRWERGDCDLASSRGLRQRPQSGDAIECTLRSRRNARGLRVEFIGNPGSVVGIAVTTAP